MTLFTASHGLLLCPVCGGNNLHHVGVEVFWRKDEDAESGFHLCSGDSQPVLITTDQLSNPSTRRDGLKIRFECECGCHKTHGITLLIRQHKGTTYLEWDA